MADPWAVSLPPVDPVDPKEQVRRGYDAVSARYRGDDDVDEHYAEWETLLRQRVTPGGRVLDLGCGCGVPLARLLSVRYQVVGVDISPVQVGRARRLVPAASFVQGDMTEIDFEAGAFDAVVSLFALIHVPLAEQPAMLRRIAGWLRPGGWLLATVGERAWTGTEDDWLGGGATMYWSHADADSYRTWLDEAGFVIDVDRFVPEGEGGHRLLLAWLRSAAAGQPGERPKRRRRSEFATTLTEDRAMAAPAITGLSRPRAASGMAATL
jgi:SAM-dependent methyltransferase